MFAVAAAIQRSVAPECAGANPVPISLMHGTLDTVVLYDGIPAFTPDALPSLTGAFDTAQFYVQRNGCSMLPVETLAMPDLSDDTTTVSRRRYLGCPATAPVTLYTITGGGHTWPGSPFSGCTIGLGATTQDVNATDLAWQFLSPHSLDD